MKKFLLMGSAILFLNGCITPYQHSGFGGGYSEMKLAEDTYQVYFSGNGFTGKDKVKKMLLRRSAELTVANGYRYFAILNYGHEQYEKEGWRTPTTINSHVNANNSGYGLFSGNSYNWNSNANGSINTVVNHGYTSTIRSYGDSAIIKMYKNNSDSNLMDASIILSNFK